MPPTVPLNRLYARRGDVTSGVHPHGRINFRKMHKTVRNSKALRLLIVQVRPVQVRPVKDLCLLSRRIDSDLFPPQGGWQHIYKTNTFTRDYWPPNPTVVLCAGYYHSLSSDPQLCLLEEWGLEERGPHVGSSCGLTPTAECNITTWTIFYFHSLWTSTHFHFEPLHFEPLTLNSYHSTCFIKKKKKKKKSSGK